MQTDLQRLLRFENFVQAPIHERSHVVRGRDEIPGENSKSVAEEAAETDPQRLSWRDSLIKCFSVDLLIDSYVTAAFAPTEQRQGKFGTAGVISGVTGGGEWAAPGREHSREARTEYECRRIRLNKIRGELVKMTCV
jgi:hypothetical protein